MEFSKNEVKIIKKALNFWEESSLVSKEFSQKLLENLNLADGRLKSFFKICLALAIVCFLFAILAAIPFFGNFFQLIFSPEVIKFLKSPSGQLLIATSIACCVYCFNWKLKTKPTLREIIYTLNVACVHHWIYFCILSLLDIGFGMIPDSYILVTVLSGLVGYIFRSTYVWFVFIAEVGIYGGIFMWYHEHSYIFFFMESRIQLLLALGVILILAQIFFRKLDVFSKFADVTLIGGLMYLFFPLLVLSLDGNNDILWTFALLATCIAGIILGVRYEDKSVQNFAISFFFLELFARFCSWGWDKIYRPIFFLILGLIFTLGTQSHRIIKFAKTKIESRKLPSHPDSK